MKPADSSTAELATVSRRGPWWWVPSLYFAQAVPFMFVTAVSTYAYTRLGLSAVVIGMTSWLGLPWMLKPLWSPLVELFGTERRWIWTTEFFASAAFATLALGYTSESFFVWTLVGYSVMAVASATHDIAADGYYMRVLTPHDQTWFSGIRSVAFRGGWIFVEFVLLWMAGRLMRVGYDPALAWGATHGAAAAAFLLLAAYHALLLPDAPAKPTIERAALGSILGEAVHIFITFFRQTPLATALPFLLLYRFAEAQLLRLAPKFLLDGRDVGGLGLLEEQIAAINGLFGISALLVGGVLGGFLAARHGLRAWLLPMALLINVPNLAYLALAYFQPQDLTAVAAAVIAEKFGYGFGFTGYMLYMLYLAQGKHQTSFYAICTGFMTLGLIVPGSVAGYPLERLGYTGFFTWIMAATVPSFVVAAMVHARLDPRFGRREETV